MINSSPFKNIAELHNLHFLESKPLAGGDINAVFLMKCKEGDFVIKTNDTIRFPNMFTAEAKGLQLLNDSSNFKIPKEVAVGKIEDFSYLILEFISGGNKSKMFWIDFAKNLAELHKTSNPYFGLDHNNYIGSLPQQNEKCDTAADFYITQRLEPQFNIAFEKGFQFKDLDTFYKNISEEIPKEPPALIHGDLWGGNYMVSKEGKPALIDPAVAFASREMDLAMMKLFGGYSEEVFDIYNTQFPLTSGWEERMQLWQLYYLLVHLNLFGSGYLARVKSAISIYS